LVTLTVPHRVRDLLAEAAQGGSMRGASLYDGAAQKRRQLEAGEKNADDVAKKRRSWVQGVRVERR
jgi:hypothetical protein